MKPLDIDWSDCPLVQRHPDYLGGSLAMRSSPRMPVEGLIDNYSDGCSVEEVAAMFEGWMWTRCERSFGTTWIEFRCGFIATALAPSARTLTITDGTTGEELSAIIRGKSHPR